MPEIVSIGECFIELFTPEPLGSADSFDLAFSGDTLNVLAMASRLGTSCGYVSRVSDDNLGDFLLDSWRRMGIDTSEVKRTRAYNAFEFYSRRPDGDPLKVVYRKESAASTISPDDLDAGYIAGARVLHLSGITQGLSPSCREAVLEAAETAHSRGVTVSYDINLRRNLWETVDEARAAVEEVLPYVDVIMPSHPDEPKALFGLESEADVIAFFLNRGVSTVAVKSGAAGAWVGTAQGMRRVPAVAPRGVYDPGGAGDTFVGGFLHGIVRGMDPFEAARWGVASAGLKVGGRSIVAQPSREEVEECLDTVELHPV